MPQKTATASVTIMLISKALLAPRIEVMPVQSIGPWSRWAGASSKLGISSRSSFGTWLKVNPPPRPCAVRRSRPFA